MAAQAEMEVGMEVVGAAVPLGAAVPPAEAAVVDPLVPVPTLQQEITEARRQRAVLKAQQKDLTKMLRAQLRRRRRLMQATSRLSRSDLVTCLQMRQ
mmetsp:Transcript_59/g.110  ORF Transcript_59/g.110 Transcript_59/m.110 type:complete len:97 (-) Transcript_59:284-574(-)|eukprot:CAMPEP_0197671458 /NCGR_PEP_ID=MMETSP1338-20131121/76745_1 /TAXON_ID=43686 ORGANISM="Pelagodinium beii, Strain RCC1491" /NCGR_SAMPLE_ID=MMETSP1338 /ASSEMBLY_ACC=CAM_ASM_000754 /LENGTH=96 /DNA_ID=CAMNT_0043251367 /DNA_START=59 /DNA_END=349 /DNA_ORIENTATION=+